MDGVKSDTLYILWGRGKISLAQALCRPVIGPSFTLRQQENPLSTS